MPLLELEEVRHSYDDRVVVECMSFTLDRGAIGCLLGPSGCGKTTVLRCIAGFEPVSGGTIRIGGEAVSGATKHVPPERRRIGMVFQDYALFPHLTVAGNIAFGLKRAPAGPSRVRSLLETVGLAGEERKYPHELSGGQQQRVALARALAPQPQLLLMDEPFSNLDVDLRERLSIEVREIIKQSGTTAILVTHDQHEAFAMADEIGIMAQGTIQQWDTPYNLYHRPGNRFVADFVGQGVFVPGRVLNPRQVRVELGLLTSDLPVDCSKGCDACDKGCQVDVLLRPDDVIHDDGSTLKAEVAHKAFRGAEILYTLKLASGERVLSMVPSHHNHAIGERIGIRLDVDHVVTFRVPGARPDAHPAVKPDVPRQEEVYDPLARAG
jgi:iron(III) transport system ATP-binding protein